MFRTAAFPGVEFEHDFRDARGVANQAVYQTHTPDQAKYHNSRVDELSLTRAVKRTYIDVGAGVPDWREEDWPE